MRLKVAIGPLFPTAVIFRGLGLVLYRKTGYKTPDPTQFSANTLLTINRCRLVVWTAVWVGVLRLGGGIACGLQFIRAALQSIDCK